MLVGETPNPDYQIRIIIITEIQKSFQKFYIRIFYATGLFPFISANNILVIREKWKRIEGDFDINTNNEILPDVIYEDIGKQIKKQRKELKITQKTLAERADFSVSHISNIENGVAKISVNALVKISNALETTTDELLADSLKYNFKLLNNRIANEIKDCTEKELRVVADMVISLKESLRKRQAFPKDIH